MCDCVGFVEVGLYVVLVVEVEVVCYVLCCVECGVWN